MKDEEVRVSKQSLVLKQAAQGRKHSGLTILCLFLVAEIPPWRQLPPLTKARGY